MIQRWIFNLMIINVHQVFCEVYWDAISGHKAWKILDSFDCGISASDRIIGGKNAALGQFPWLARIGYTIEGEDDVDWMCGGALITDRHVLTAAHCLQTSPDYQLSSIRVGEYDTRTNPDCQLTACAPPTQDRKVKHILIHPSFNNPPFHNDIAVLELEYPVELNDYVLPICLPQSDQIKKLQVGELLTVAGWGKMNLTTEERAKILQFVARPWSREDWMDGTGWLLLSIRNEEHVKIIINHDKVRERCFISINFKVPVVTPEVCDSFGKGFKLAVSEICAGAQLNKDACGGDSGGPLMKVYDTIEGPKTFVMGVVSFGPTICGIKKPGVYSSVPHFLKWILDSIL